MEMATRLDLTVLNTRGVTTFRRPDTKGLIVDVTLQLATRTAACRIWDWRVLNYTASDHQYVTYTIQERRVIPPVTARRAAKRWNVARLDETALLQAIETAPHHFSPPYWNHHFKFQKSNRKILIVDLENPCIQILSKIYASLELLTAILNLDSLITRS